jgi:hypothetical protein
VRDTAATTGDLDPRTAAFPLCYVHRVEVSAQFPRRIMGRDALSEKVASSARIGGPLAPAALGAAVLMASCNALLGNDSVIPWNGDDAGHPTAPTDAGDEAQVGDSSISAGDAAPGDASPGDASPGVDSATCDDGGCAPPCPSGSSRCNGVCIDTNGDNANCGSCGNACLLPTSCSAAQCVFDCGGTIYTAGSIADGTYELLSNAGFALNVSGNREAGTGLDQWAFEGPYEEFTVALAGGGQYKILAQSGLAVTGQGENNQATVEPYAGASEQLYAFVQAGSSWKIVDVKDCLALDDWGGGVQTMVGDQLDQSDAGDQLWTLVPIASVTLPLADGTYALIAGSGLALDDPGGGGAGTVPDQVAYAGSDQEWTVSLVSGQEYKILSASGEALTMSATQDTTIAGISSYTGSTDQLWVFWPTGLGSYSVVNVGTAMALDDNGGGGVGVQIQQWTWNSPNDHQEWTITPE